MTDQQYKARFINSWKRRHTRKTKEGSRLKYAYNVPSTSEHGSLAMWEAQPASSFRPEKKNPIKKTGSVAHLHNFTGTVSLQKNGNVRIEQKKK